MSAFKDANKKIENAVVNGYKKIEEDVVSGYKKIEAGVTAGYRKIEDRFIDAFLAAEGETTQDARARLNGANPREEEHT